MTTHRFFQTFSLLFQDCLHKTGPNEFSSCHSRLFLEENQNHLEHAGNWKFLHFFCTLRLMIQQLAQTCHCKVKSGTDRHFWHIIFWCIIFRVWRIRAPRQCGNARIFFHKFLHKAVHIYPSPAMLQP